MTNREGWEARRPLAPSRPLVGRGQGWQAVRDGEQVLYLDRLRGHASVPIISRVGSRLPLHTTGVGKALLAHAPAEVHDAVLGRLTRETPYTVTQPGTLLRQLQRVRRDDYATTVEEMSLGACSVAVPMRRDGEVDASGVRTLSLGLDRDGGQALLPVTSPVGGPAIPVCPCRPPAHDAEQHHPVGREDRVAGNSNQTRCDLNPLT